MEISILELVAVGFNLCYVILAAIRSIWCWPFGIVGSALSIWLFVDSKIYAEAILFSYYVLMGFYGWWNWKKSDDPSRTSLRIITFSVWSHGLIALLGVLLTAVLFFTLKGLTDAEMPLLDSFTTVFSFIATWMVAKKILENWIYWIVLNFLTIFLYFSRDLSLYAILSALYVILSVYGYISWRKDQKLQIQKTHE
ncbi:MAG: nicotinamide riboside transporter PnuC [Flavobacteriales bacterium]|nr:nicotinamide riboside transporter PnuC [Flavobacteriales bacterium]